MTPIEKLEPGQVRISGYEYDDAGNASGPGPLETLTLGELDGTLPHGFVRGPELVRSYRFNAPKMGLRRKIGELRQKPKIAGSLGRLTAYVLALALESIGGEPMPKQREKAALLVAGLTVGDVFALSMDWRRVCAPRGIKFEDGSCGHCGSGWSSVRINLDTVGVRALPADATAADSPRARVGLYDGIPFGEGTVQTVVVKPPTWLDFLWGVHGEAQNNKTLLRARTLGAAICATDIEVGGRPIQRLPLQALDELMPDDEALLDETISRIVPTPEMVVEVDCPDCGQKNVVPMDPWNNPGFFGG